MSKGEDTVKPLVKRGNTLRSSVSRGFDGLWEGTPPCVYAGASKQLSSRIVEGQGGLAACPEHPAPLTLTPCLPQSPFAAASSSSSSSCQNSRDSSRQKCKSFFLGATGFLGSR